MEGKGLEVTGLAKHFPVRASGGFFSKPLTLKAVDGVSFSVPRGKTLGIVGESGCGKSTTARLVLGLMPATAGTANFDNKNISSAIDAEWRAARRRMQMVYQDPLGALDRRLSVGLQVAEPLDIHGIGERAARRDKALSLFDAVGLRRDMFERFPHELSGGQRQRVVLARALITDPGLLVCDEPVSALDVSIQAQVVNLLMDLQEQRGLTYVFISHDLKVVRQVSHEVAVMYLGKIVEQGTPEEMFHAPAHPYTQALVSAIPTPRRRRMGGRVILQGDPPNPVNVPAGCAFHPRCPVAVARCSVEAPPLRVTGPGRLVACHLVASPMAEAA
jgi:oligopeptide/dipeptide ABC transporter ATP-binding protein